METNAMPRVILNPASAPGVFNSGIASKAGNVLAGEAVLGAVDPGIAYVAIPGLTDDMVATANIRTPGGTIGAQYKCEHITAPDRLKITSIQANKATQTLDTSTLQYTVVIG